MPPESGPARRHTTGSDALGSSVRCPRQTGAGERSDSRRSRSQLVAGATDGPQQPALAVAELAPQVADVDVDDVGHGHEVVVPDVLRDLRAGEHAIRIAGEVLQDGVL